MINLPAELRCFPLPMGRKYPPPPRFYDTACPLEDLDPGGNIGVSTTGLLVVDIDAHKGGYETIAMLDMVDCVLPETFTVSTARGGEHRYFRPPHAIANSVDKVGQGVDIRGHHGYVVGPGSVIEGVEYTIKIDAPIADAPQWLIDRCEAVRVREAHVEDRTDLDTPQAISRATDYLRATEPAVQGAGGDLHTFKVAAAAMDFGLSVYVARELMIEHWNDRCAPPWDLDELDRKVINAAEYRTKGVGSSDPRQEFDPVKVPQSGLKARPFGLDDFKPRGPRRWVLGNVLMRRVVTVLVAPGGTGKSVLTLATAASVATGRNLLGMSVKEQVKVWVYNNEDDEDELARRTQAIWRAHDIPRQEAPGNLYLNSGDVKRLKIARLDDHGKLRESTADVAQLKSEIRDLGIGLFVVDPLVSLHQGNENDAGDAEFVMDILIGIARDTHCAVLAVHHTRKPSGASPEGQSGNMDSARGSTAIAAAARVVLTLESASKKEAEKHKWPLDERGRYIQLECAKNNYAPKGAARWFKMDSVAADDTPGAETVGVPRHFTLVERLEGASLIDEQILRLLDGKDFIDVEAAIDFFVDDPLYTNSRDRGAVRKCLNRANKVGWGFRKVGGDGAPKSRVICRAADIQGDLDASNESDDEG